MKTRSTFQSGKHRIVFVFIAVILYSCDKRPVADFDANNTSPKVGDQITLRDQSSEDPDSWEWKLTPGNFEYLDGTNLNTQDPKLMFHEAGAYTVTLTASNPSGSDTKSKADYITVMNDHSPVVKVYSPSLENNLLGDSPEREVRLYLPPDYFDNTSKHYPVVYLLHSYYADQNVWWEGEEGLIIIDIEEMLNELISEGAIAPMIVVAPNSSNRFLGSHYANSSSTGLWEDYITQDVVSYIDAHFRTIPDRESRGIAGHSMGGMGAFKLAMKHPELFGVLYSHSGAVLSFQTVFLDFGKQDLITASTLQNFTLSDFFIYGVMVGYCFACAPAYAPNADAAPVYGDFPLTEEGEIISSTWQRWLQHDPYSMLSKYTDNLKQLKILMDCGDSDEYRASNTLFAEKLSELGIEHVFETYEGGHMDRTGLRFGSAGFPFFDQYLVHE